MCSRTSDELCGRRLPGDGHGFLRAGVLHDVVDRSAVRLDDLPDRTCPADLLHPDLHPHRESNRVVAGHGSTPLLAHLEASVNDQDGT